LARPGRLRYLERSELGRAARRLCPRGELAASPRALIKGARALASFRKHTPADLVRTLVAQGVEAKPGGSRRTLTVMFTDLAGFTALSERLMEGIVPILSRYLEETSAAVVGHRGTIDKFIGDAVMAFWGAPAENAAQAIDACRAALEAAEPPTPRRPT